MIRSDRNVYVAAHVTPEVRDALERAKDQTGVSISEQIWTMLKAQLEAAGLLPEKAA